MLRKYIRFQYDALPADAPGIEAVNVAVKELKTEAQKAQDAVKKQIGDLEGKMATKDDVDTLTKSIETVNKYADELAVKLEAKSVEPDKKSFGEVLAKTLSDNESKLKELATNAGQNVRFHVKAVAPLTLGATFGAGVIRGYDEPGITGKPYNPRFIMSLISVMNGGPGSNPITWVERNPKEGGPGWTLEQATKPNTDWVYVRNSAQAEFLAVTVAVTKQALLSMPVLEQEIYDLLNNEMNNKLEQDIITGSGVSPIIKGINTYASAFAAGALAATIQDPNDFDVLRVAIGQVLKANYFPTAILVSIDTATSMDLTKASDGHYVLPPFTTADGTVIKGVRVYASNFITADNFIVGDMRRYLFNIVEGLTIDVGYINDQFVKNEATVRAELYGMGRVKNHETLAFVKGTFSAAKTALAIPTP